LFSGPVESSWQFSVGLSRSGPSDRCGHWQRVRRRYHLGWKGRHVGGGLELVAEYNTGREIESEILGEVRWEVKRYGRSYKKAS